MPRKKTDLDVSGVWRTGAEAPAVFDFHEIFKNDQPVELDVGCGKGLFLFNQAQARPEVNFLGVDWSRTYSRLAAARIVRRGIRNVQIVSDDVWRLFPRFPDRSFQAIHAYFPDPWWKMRHRKRRLFRPEFLEQVHRLLIDGGRLFVATDVEEYFQVIVALTAQSPCLERISDPPPASGETDLDFLTHFERKYRKTGRAIHRATYQMHRSPSPAAGPEGPNPHMETQ
jgi:tRNA (guanine-N7-)-methyltransferase